MVRFGSKSASLRLAKVFDGVAESKQAAFIPYLTAGYPKKADTVELLLALQVIFVAVVVSSVQKKSGQMDRKVLVYARFRSLCVCVCEKLVVHDPSLEIPLATATVVLLRQLLRVLLLLLLLLLMLLLLLLVLVAAASGAAD